MTKLIERIKLIVSKNEPNSINLLEVEKINVEENNYRELMNYWQSVEKKEKEADKVYEEYKKIKDFYQDNNNYNIGMFSLFYFKDSGNFLSVGNYENELFYMEVKCKEYENVLSNAMDNNNELFVLTYWIL